MLGDIINNFSPNRETNTEKRRSSRLTVKSQFNSRCYLLFLVYWPIDSIREVFVYLTPSQFASCFSFDPLTWNEAFYYPYFSVSPPCKVKTHLGNIGSKEIAYSETPFREPDFKELFRCNYSIIGVKSS